MGRVSKCVFAYDPSLTVLRWPFVVDRTLKSNYYYYYYMQVLFIITWNTTIHSHKLEAFLVQVLCRSDAMKSCVLSVSVLRGPWRWPDRIINFLWTAVQRHPLIYLHWLTGHKTPTYLLTVQRLLVWCVLQVSTLNLTIILTHRCISDFYSTQCVISVIYSAWTSYDIRSLLGHY